MMPALKSSSVSTFLRKRSNMPINRIQHLMEPRKDELMEAICKFVLNRLESALEEIGDEVMVCCKRAERPLKDVQIIIEHLAVGYLECPSPLSNAKRNAKRRRKDETL